MGSVILTIKDFFEAMGKKDSGGPEVEGTTKGGKTMFERAWLHWERGRRMHRTAKSGRGWSSPESDLKQW